MAADRVHRLKYIHPAPQEKTARIGTGAPYGAVAFKVDPVCGRSQERLRLLLPVVPVHNRKVDMLRGGGVRPVAAQRRPVAVDESLSFLILGDQPVRHLRVDPEVERPAFVEVQLEMLHRIRAGRQLALLLPVADRVAPELLADRDAVDRQVFQLPADPFSPAQGFHQKSLTPFSAANRSASPRRWRLRCSRPRRSHPHRPA